MTKLRKLQLDPKGNMSGHLGEIRRLMDRIGLLGKPLDDYEKPVLLIGSLPSDYDNVVESHSDIVAEQTSGSPTAGSCFSGTACTAFCDCSHYKAKQKKEQGKKGKSSEKGKKEQGKKGKSSEKGKKKDGAASNGSGSSSGPASGAMSYMRFIAKADRGEDTSSSSSSDGEPLFIGMAVKVERRGPSGDWMLDSGASSHVCVEPFTSFKKFNAAFQVWDGEITRGNMCGSVVIEAMNSLNQSEMTLVLDKVEFSPSGPVIY
ncbi:hypothetical protein PC114_g15949 [Phytophthora cactorum]|uniref:Uncharacterized protein n=2 Tax=Phytophthora cactorum TaxID=29920 RepID=A0A8T1CPC5_9STRA|nr:hypothetical protein PC114_g15949 [Phytophthora cactorum]KAG2924126.1 hypothetical protein PC117_g15473 [Phytophthora cactorum]